MRDTLTGSRIRERRIAAGIKQADLARRVEISASYLNLIEHNRRRIAGKLLLRIASVLDTDATTLSEGAGAALISALREAAATNPQSLAEITRVDEFAGRFPGWARLLTTLSGRVAELETAVEGLTDRMTHDPHLAASLHEMLSTVTAIRSAAAILAEPGDVAQEWRARFQRNLDQDSTRLAETSRALATYLEADGEEKRDVGSPLEEVFAVWDEAGHHLPALEEGGAADAVLGDLGAGLSQSARAILLEQLRRYQADARALPLAQCIDALDACGPDPIAVAARTGAAPDLAMRRIAAMPSGPGRDPVGLIICDASGVPLYRRQMPGFAMPRVGAGCPIWLLYRALTRPYVLLGGALRPITGDGRVFWAEAIASPKGPARINQDPDFLSQMLIRPLPADQANAAVEPVGSACRICPRADCDSRREPSVLAGAA